MEHGYAFNVVLRRFVPLDLFDDEQAAGMLAWPQSGFDMPTAVWVPGESAAARGVQTTARPPSLAGSAIAPYVCRILDRPRLKFLFLTMCHRGIVAGGYLPRCRRSAKARYGFPPPKNPARMADDVDVTQLLAALQAGVPNAAERLARAVMTELHRIAEYAMHREVDGHTLQPTELVDEVLVRLIGQRHAHWEHRAQFYAVAAQMIRRILVDHARQRRRIKRDHGVRVTLKEEIAAVPDRSVDLIALDDAMQQLDAHAPRQARVVELRFFGGLDIVETATALDISPATVKRDWAFARAFLLKTLKDA